GSHPSRPPARRQTGRRPPRPSRTDESEERAHGGSPGIRVEAPRQTTHGLTSTTADTTSATDPKILRHFTRRGRAPTPRRTTRKIGRPLLITSSGSVRAAEARGIGRGEGAGGREQVSWLRHFIFDSGFGPSGRG